MRSKYKKSTIADHFPLMEVNNGTILSKYGDVSFCFKVELPELFTLSDEDYDSLNGAWIKAIKCLPDNTIIHKQDWFIRREYIPRNDVETFLSRSFEQHFNMRPHTDHVCYVFITQTTKLRIRQKSLFSSLCRKNIIPAEPMDADTISKFSESVNQFQTILNDSDYLKISLLTDSEITGENGIIEKYFCLSDSGNKTLSDIRLEPDRVFVGDKELLSFTISDLDYLPSAVSADKKVDRLSTDRSEIRLSFSALVGLMLPFDHVYNQYIFKDNSEETLKNFERLARNLNSLSKYSRANSINKEWIDLYLNQAYSEGLTSVRCHFNIMGWADNPEDCKRIRNSIGSALASMGCVPHYNTIDVPVHFWAGIPGNSGDFPAEDTFHTFLEPAVCFFTGETHYRSSLSAFGIKMVDRHNGVPLHLDISDEPMRLGMITNRNRFILGPSGSGKSFFTNHLIRQYYEQGAHTVLVDTGNSYKGLSELINKRTKGRDGIYLTYTEQEPISFNPFYTEDGTYDIEKKESLKTLILTLWKRENEPPRRSEEVGLSNAITLYLKILATDKRLKPSFNTFYEFLNGPYRKILKSKKVREKEFDIENLLNVLEPYYKGGEYDYLLNSDKEMDLLHKRFIVFELDNIRDHPILFPIVTIIIMETFINKMRRLQGIRKVILIEEAWKAIAKAGMAEYIKYLFKTVRKYFGEAIIVTQEVDDIISSEIVKDTIINNADTKILLDQRKYLNKFDGIQSLLGLSEKEKNQILSINLSNDPQRNYKEVWIGMGGVHSAVYATEVSPEEYLTYTTEESEKIHVFETAKNMGGDLEAAIKKLADNRKYPINNSKF